MEKESALQEAQEVLRRIALLSTPGSLSSVGEKSHTEEKKQRREIQRIVIPSAPLERGSHNPDPSPRITYSRREVVVDVPNVEVINQSTGVSGMKKFFVILSLGVLALIVIQSVGLGIITLGAVLQDKYVNPALAGQLEMLEKLNKINSGGNASISQEITIPTFSCRTAEERDLGFARATPVSLTHGGVAVMNSGCAVILADRVNMLSGEKYLIGQDDPQKPGNYIACGTVAGLRDSPDDCKRYLYDRAGQQVKLMVFRGGHLRFTL